MVPYRPRITKASIFTALKVVTYLAPDLLPAFQAAIEANDQGRQAEVNEKEARKAAWAPVALANGRVYFARAALAKTRPATQEYVAALRELQDAQSEASLALAEYNKQKAQRILEDK